MSSLEMLKGKTLRSVSRGKSADLTRSDKSRAYGGVHGQNEDTITFHCEDGAYVFLADGDCCSQTTIDSVEGPTTGLIAEVREPRWDAEREERAGELKFYKATLVIEGKGFLDVEYRNESNGYYGGSLEFWGQTVPTGGNADG